MLQASIPIIGAIMGAGGTIWEKTILNKKKISSKLYLSAAFLAIVIVMLPFMFFVWDMKPEALEPTNLLIFAMVIIFSIIANLFVIHSMKWAKMSNIEPARMLEPLFVILIAIIFSFTINGELYERNMKVVIPAIIAGLAIVGSHFKKDHLKFSKPFIAAVLGSLFFAIELVMTRMLLEFYSPTTLYFTRCVAIALTAMMLFKPKYHKIENNIKLQMFGIATIWFLYRVLVYYGYLHLGVIFTTLMVMLMPIFIYLFAWKFLNEKVTKRNIIASVIILACVLYVTIT